MISKKNIRLFCSEDPSLIENYDKAIADTTQVWDCHHRGEILPCGRYSKATLKKFGLYYGRPASELIFLTATEHTRMHQLGNKNCLGKHLSHETKAKCRLAKLGLKWYNDGTNTIRARECPPGFVSGRLAAKGEHYYNNSSVCVRARECPPGFVPGMLKRV